MVNLKKTRGLKKWVGTSKEKHDWIIKNVNFEHIINPNNGHDDIYNALWNASQSIEGQAFISDLRKRWSRYTYEKKTFNKAITITLDPNTVKKLNHLAKDTSRREILEKLITNHSTLEQELRAQHQKALKEKKENLEAKWPKENSGGLIENIIYKDKFFKLAAVFKKQSNILNEILFKLCTLDYICKEAELTNETLLNEEMININNEHNELLEYYRKDLANTELLKEVEDLR